MTLSITIFSITTLSIKGVLRHSAYMAFSIAARAPLCWESGSIYCYADWRYAECRYA